MKKMLLSLVLVLLALPSFGALQYDFYQKSTSEGAVVPSTDLSGRATIDKDRSRIDFLAGDVYPAGTYLLSTDGARRLYFVDPEKKWYTEYNTASVATAIAASNITVTNLKSDLVKLGDSDTIAGIPAEHYQLTLTYDMTVLFRSMPLKLNVRTTVHSWTTARFGDIARSAFTNTLRTGNVEIDRIVELETTRVPGFPLRQTVTTATTNLSGRPPKSKLDLPTTRVTTRETVVTAIKEITPGLAMFALPVTYRRADPVDVPKAPTQMLQFEPVTK